MNFLHVSLRFDYHAKPKNLKEGVVSSPNVWLEYLHVYQCGGFKENMPEVKLTYNDTRLSNYEEFFSSSEVQALLNGT
jgi:hypothetical protein